MITLRRYTKADKNLWNEFVKKSKNGLFLFDRNYMDYHADRFTDHSLMFYENGTLLALLPANVKDGTLYSHQGLTFGGIVSDSRMTTARMLVLLEKLLTYGKSHKVKKIVYKVIPSVYQRLPAQEDLYGLYRHHARLVGRDIASVVDQTQPVPFQDSMKRVLKTAMRLNLTIKENHDYAEFMGIVSSLLATKYHARPTHTTEEITRLAAGFPGEIRLFTVREKEDMLGGVIIYEYPTVAHCQYIAASARGKKLGVLSPLFHKLLTRYFADKRYFSFGKSTEQDGAYLNEGLIRNKEHYGGRGVVHDIYELPVR